MKISSKIFILLFSFSIIYSQEKVNNSKLVYSLGDCQKTALENNNNLKSSIQRIGNAGAKYNEASASQYPQLKFMGSYTRLSDIPPFEVTMPPPISRTFTISPVILDNYNFRVNLQQPVFTGFRIQAAKDMAELGVQASMDDYNKEKLELLYNIKNTYYNLLKMKMLLNIINENMRMIESHLNDANNFLKQGMLERNDVLKIEVQFANLKVTKIETQNMLDILKMNLCNLMGITLNSNFDIEDSEVNTNIEIANLNELLQNAMNNRNELKMMDKRNKINEANLTLARSNWYPQVFLNANYTYANPNQRLMPAEEKFKDTWDIGISLSFDIWNWGSTSAKVEQAETQFNESQNNYSLLKDGITLEVTQSYFNLLQIKEKLFLTEKTIEQSNENYRISKDKFQKGLLSNTEMLDAETMNFQTKINHLQAKIDFQAAQAKLDKTIGK